MAVQVAAYFGATIERREDKPDGDRGSLWIVIDGKPCYKIHTDDPLFPRSAMF